MLRAAFVLAVSAGLASGGAMLAGQVIVNTGSPAPAEAPRRTGTSAISGVVRDGSSGRPVAGAVVTLSTSPRSRTPAIDRMATDGAGRFVFTGLAAGDDYYVHAGRMGYFDGGYGRDRPSQEALAQILVGEGQWFSRADVQLWKPGAIAGTVVDEAGEPVVGVPIRALPLIKLAGVEHVAAGIITTTDDRGAYRLTGLVPGRYLVQVPSVQAAVPAGLSPYEVIGMTAEQYANAARLGREPPLPATMPVDRSHALAFGQYVTPPISGGTIGRAYPPAFYPGVRAVADAVAVEPRHGEDLTGIDLRLQPEATARVSGRVVGPPDQIAGLVLRLVPPGSEGLAHGGEAATTLVGNDGAFAFLNVPLGAYTLVAARSVMQYHFVPSGSNLDATLPEPPGFNRSRMGAGDIPSAPRGVGYAYAALGGDDRSWAHVPVAVDAGGIDNLIVELVPTVAVRGRVVWESGEPDPPTFTRMTPSGPVRGRAEALPVYADPADGNPALGMPRGEYTIATNEFIVEGLKVGTYLLRIVGAPIVKSVVWNGRDHSERGFDASEGHDFDGVVVTVTDRTATLAGTVRREDGATASGATVLAFPADRARWARFGFAPARLRAVTADSSGRYSLGVPAGEYFVVAVDAVPVDGWQDSAYLARAAIGANPIRVDWNETHTQDAVVRTIR
jgi:hypothetical protein